MREELARDTDCEAMPTSHTTPAHTRLDTLHARAGLSLSPPRHLAPQCVSNMRSRACALRLERRYEQGGLPTRSGRRPLTEAAGCVVRRLGGEGASVADIEGQTREGGE